MTRNFPLPQAPDRKPDLEDDFTAATLGADIWVDHYLPHWTSPERSRARYDFDHGGLRLRIDADQLDWRAEDAPLRVSNLQTGTFSGPLGSERGTHRHRPDGLLVRTQTPERLLWAPTAGRVDVTVSASVDEGCMLAAWLVGTEHLSAEDTGEICIFEIDADGVGDSRSRARCGVKAHSDGRLTTDMTDVVVPVDASKPHTWTAIWGAVRHSHRLRGGGRETHAAISPLPALLDDRPLRGRPPFRECLLSEDSSYPLGAWLAF
jgi:hypothetical protein